jgi:hypothetical protein
MGRKIIFKCFKCWQLSVTLRYVYPEPVCTIIRPLSSKRFPCRLTIQCWVYCPLSEVNFIHMTFLNLALHPSSCDWLSFGLYRQIIYYSYCKISGAGIAQWYSAGLQAEWSGVPVPAGTGNFSLHHRVQTDCGIHPASYPMGTGVSFPGGKAGGA